MGGPAIVPVPSIGGATMNRNLINRCPPTRLLSPLALIILTGLGLSVATAQTSSQSQIVRPATPSSATATSGSGQYYFEFRSRQAWDYGHDLERGAIQLQRFRCRHRTLHGS